AEYSQYFGVQGTTQLALSDVLGNHRINIYTNLFYDFRNSDYMVTYFYLPRRLDIGVGGYHNAYFFFSYDLGIIRDRNYGLSTYLSLPLSRYRRVDFSAGFVGIDRDYLDFSEEDQAFLEEIGYLPNTRRRFVLLGLSWVDDTSLWGITGPVNGRRSAVGLMGSPGLFGKHGAEFLTARLDWRRYYKVGKEYNFVVRVAAGASGGKQPQQFFVGGVENWINREFAGGYVRVNNIEDIYFASFEMPFRGGSYYELAGNSFLLTNLEFRFPLIRYFLMGWPLPIGFEDIRGALFVDVAGARYRGERFVAFTRSPSGFYKLEDLKMAFGFGMRANIGFLVLQFDVGWPTDLYATSSSPRYYWSLGAEF
ncbi:MAG: BamA/TamA family outer membrane protein, partial [candidate division KSB1 bacterium]|nr:BamA/TamA family outer membrane protein [candidate division KSB1 bacterium]